MATECKFLKRQPALLATLAAVLMGTSVVLAQTSQSQGTGLKTQSASPQNPELKIRPLPKPDESSEPVGRMHLDVVVTDAAGATVPGLGVQDFQVFDNALPQKIVSFHALSSKANDPDSRVSIFLVIDTVNSALVDVSYMRDGAEKFLRQNGGHLAQPVTVVLFTDAGFQVVGTTSLDGNRLADAVHAIQPVVHTIHSAAGGEANLERFQLSGQALGAIVAREVPVPGRKMMIWMGPGWPLMNRPEVNYNSRSHALNFEALQSLSNQLREARMVICSAGGGSEYFVQDFLKPVKSEKDANSSNLALQVLAVHSGGQTLNAANLSRSDQLLNSCMQQIGDFYSITFDPPHADKAFEFHGLKVTVDKPGLTTHTNAGYYSEP